jgi:hypothetical protein
MGQVPENGSVKWAASLSAAAAILAAFYTFAAGPMWYATAKQVTADGRYSLVIDDRQGMKWGTFRVRIKNASEWAPARDVHLTIHALDPATSCKMDVPGSFRKVTDPLSTLINVQIYRIAPGQVAEVWFQYGLRETLDKCRRELRVEGKPATLGRQHYERALMQQCIPLNAAVESGSIAWNIPIGRGLIETESYETTTDAYQGPWE